MVPSAPPPSLPGWTTLVQARSDGTPDLTNKIGPTPLPSERVIAVYVKNRDLRGSLPDIDR
eukprot:6786607-Karenia_brevis.AAC.1